MPKVAIPSMKWMSAADALRLCRQLFTEEEHEAQRRLVNFAADEIVEAHCQRLVIRPESRDAQITPDCDVPAELWADLRRLNHSSNWTTGEFEFERYDAIFGTTEVRVYGVTFCTTLLRAHRASLDERRITFDASRAASPIVSDTQPPASPYARPATTRHPGGRPRKDFWEDLLVATGIAIYAGFQPQRVAHVERWMANWLSENGHEASEVAIRQRARSVFNAYVAERDKR